MFSQVDDFAAECRQFSRLIDNIRAEYGAQTFERPTLFKQWTLDDILGHLHVWNWAADTSLHAPAEFQRFLNQALEAFHRGEVRTFEQRWLNGLSGDALWSTWREFADAMSARFHQADPSARMAWAGPSMSVRSAISARLMETWAHAQAVYDVFGIERPFDDRLKNIVRLGINTYSWTFNNRQLSPPQPRPYVGLEAPSGALWTFGEPSESDAITGQAAEFCQVVTQVRNIQDTSLTVIGEAANQWMRIAQCFAGAPEDPPAPGERHRSQEKP